MRNTRRRTALIAAALAVAGTAGTALATTSSTSAPQPRFLSAPKEILWPVGHEAPEAAALPALGTSALAPTDYNNLVFHGGAVMHRPKVYLVFWGSEWKNGFRVGPHNRYTHKTAISYETRFFANVGGSRWAGTQTQFCDNIPAGSASCKGETGAKFVTNPTQVLRGVWVDGSKAPSNIATTGLVENVTNDPVASEALKAANHFQTHDIDALFMIFTPPGHAATAYGSVYCAYHSEVTPASGTGHGVRYAFMPFTPEQGSGCGGNSVNTKDDAFGHGYFDSYTLAGGHEWEEAVTDPDSWPTQDGWNDLATSENGDKCAYFNARNIRIGGYYFAVQPMWSNEANGHTGGCAYSRGTGIMPVPFPAVP